MVYDQVQEMLMGVDQGYRFGFLPRGPKNLITDVQGVRVGHVTLADGDVQTGVTAMIPGPGSSFREKFPAAVHVINGFGKSCGLMQVAELGTLETPILLTNTFSVPECSAALLSWMLGGHEEIGRTTGTVNPVVMECNDGRLNDIRRRSITQEQALEALQGASSDFEEGSIGAGRGMRCYGYKGGIGSSSRQVQIGGVTYTVGSLLLTNFGSKADLLISGKAVGESHAIEPDQGSCIIILATDAPLDARQLGRCARRAQNGLARTGSITGGGSGEIVLMFSTVNRVPHHSDKPLLTCNCLHEEYLDVFFRAVVECVEESVISSLLHATTVTGMGGNKIGALSP